MNNEEDFVDFCLLRNPIKNKLYNLFHCSKRMVHLCLNLFLLNTLTRLLSKISSSQTKVTDSFQ